MYLVKFMKKRTANQMPAVVSKITEWFLILLASVYLLYTGFGGYVELTQHKLAMFLLLSVVFFAALVLLPLEYALTGEARLSTLRPVISFCAAEYCLLVFLLFTFLSAALSPTPRAAFFGNLRNEGAMTFLLYVGICLSASQFAAASKRLLAAFAIAVGLCCVLSLLQFLGGNPLSLYPSGMNYYDANKRYAGEFLGTIGNVDLFSAVLCIAIPTLWISLWKLRSPRRWWLALPLALALAVLIKMHVLGGLVGVTVGTLFTVPNLLGQKRARIAAWTAVIVLSAAALALIYAYGAFLGGLFSEASAVMHGKWNDAFGSGRIYIWRKTWELVPERLFFGGGPDTLGLRTDALFERIDEAQQIQIRSFVDTAHNEYLNLLVNNGLLALLAYLAALGLVFVKWVRHAAQNPAAAICGGAVFAYAAQAFFGISSPISAPFFWAALGLLIGNCKEKTGGNGT